MVEQPLPISRELWERVCRISTLPKDLRGFMLMLWRLLEGRSRSRLEGIRGLMAFIAEHLSYRRYAATWIDYGERLLSHATGSISGLAGWGRYSSSAVPSKP